jgi:hypothetical protein
MNNTTLAYAAGIFDGEGYVDIYKATQSKASKSPSLYVRVVIAQKDGVIMNWLEDNFGGYVSMNRKDKYYIYRWDIRSKNALKFLSAIAPFVKIKRPQVMLVLEYEKRKLKFLESLKGHQGFPTLPLEEIRWRLEIREKLKALKKEYAPYIKNEVIE